MTPEEWASKYVRMEDRGNDYWNVYVEDNLIWSGGKTVALHYIEVISHTVSSAIKEALAAPLLGKPLSESSTLSEEDIEEIRAREKLATPGPWIHCPEEIRPDGSKVIVRGIGQDVCTALRVKYPVEESGDEYDPWKDNEFIAYAREDIPKLLEHIDYLETLLRILCQDDPPAHYLRGVEDGKRVEKERVELETTSDYTQVDFTPLLPASHDGEAIVDGVGPAINDHLSGDEDV